MRLYLENQTRREERLSRLTQPGPTLRERIVDTIVSKANGMFLAAELHLASLASKHSLSRVRKALDTIPVDLEGVYNETMFRIGQQNKDDVELAKNVLAWISYAQEPLSIMELLHALAMDPDEVTLDPEAMPDAATLVDICAGLVTIDDSAGPSHCSRVLLAIPDGSLPMGAQKHCKHLSRLLGHGRIPRWLLPFNATISHTRQEISVTQICRISLSQPLTYRRGRCMRR